MNAHPPASPDSVTPDDLVAYLDGELDAEASRQLERRLADDPASREKLLQLQQTWDLLDALPQSHTDNVFTRTTVEMVARAVEGGGERRKGIARGIPSRSWLALVLVAAAALAGYALTAAVLIRAERRLLAELPLVEHFETYRVAGGIAFLEQLERKELFDGSSTQLPTPRLDALPSAARRSYLESLTDQDKQVLQQRRQAVREAPESQRQAAREVQQQLAEHPRADVLWNVLNRYRLWLDALPTQQRAELLALSDDQRLQEVERLVREQEELQTRQLVRSPLSPQDLDAIITWLDRYARTHEAEILDALPETAARNIRSMRQPEARQALMLNFLRQTPLNANLPRPTADELRELASQLSPEALAIWEQTQAPQERAQLLRRWIGAALFFRLPSVASDQTLRQFLNQSLSPTERTYLESLPRDRLRQQLLYRYLRDRGGAGEPAK